MDRVKEKPRESDFRGLNVSYDISSPDAAGDSVWAQPQERTALCDVWIKKMKILSCACMTRQNVWIRTLLYENVK